MGTAMDWSYCYGLELPLQREWSVATGLGCVLRCAWLASAVGRDGAAAVCIGMAMCMCVCICACPRRLVVVSERVAAAAVRCVGVGCEMDTMVAHRRLRRMMIIDGARRGRPKFRDKCLVSDSDICCVSV